MQNISMSDAELLKYAIENGMIDTAYVRDMIEMQKRKEIFQIIYTKAKEKKQCTIHTTSHNKGNNPNYNERSLRYISFTY